MCNVQALQLKCMYKHTCIELHGYIIIHTVSYDNNVRSCVHALHHHYIIMISLFIFAAISGARGAEGRIPSPSNVDILQFLLTSDR